MKPSKNLCSMEVKELMIGDWVECVDSTHKEKVYAQIDAIEEGQTCILVILDNCNWFLDISFIKPIPLTREILEKNGFLCDGESWWYQDFRIVLSTSKGVSLVCGRQIKFCYVHELQHALRLCEIEKEIVL